MTRIWIANSAYNDILKEYKQKEPLETGGVLMGYWTKEGAVITDIIGPGENSIHKKVSFIPDNKYHIQEVARIYKDSGRTITYLGDWHSHPDAESYLSSQDIRTLIKISKHKASRLKFPIMMVYGTNPICLNAWVLLKKRKGICIKRDIQACEVLVYD